MSTFFAAFPDSIPAQQVIRQLLSDGIELDDISLVTRDSNGIERLAPPSTGDASFFVDRSDDPEHDLVDTASRNADFEAAEISRIGGGISTSDKGQNVDSVDQMDDSQSAAEDNIWPREDTSSSEHDLDSLHLAVNTGYPTPVTPLDNDFARGASDFDRSLEAVDVPGFGVVMGGGDLATAAFDWSNQNGKVDTPNLLTYLHDEGVPPEPANELLGHLENGGAILAVALTPQVDEGALTEVVERHGAITSGWFGAPRY